MLNITVSSSGAGARHYFAAHLQKEESRRTRGDAAYYAQGEGHSETAPGHWGGKGAALLGLSGEVRQEDFAALCENRRPGQRRTRLTVRDKADRRPGYDFTFNAPKSVSLMVALTGDERLRAAFFQSVNETMTAFQQVMEVRVRRKGENRDRITGNMVWAKFDHALARPVQGLSDPHLHSHVYVFNATYDAVEEKWKAGQFANLKRDGAYFEAVFHAHLAHATAALGYAIERKAKGWEIGGIPRTLIDKFSRRTGQVEAAAQKRGITNPKQKAELARYTRAAKEQDAQSPSERAAAWRVRLTEEEKSLLRELHATSLARSPKQPVSREAEVRQALDFAEAHCFERKSVVPVRELQAAALRAGLGVLAPAQIDLETTRRLASGRWLTPSEKEQRPRLITTREVLEEEARIVQVAQAGRNRALPLVPLYRTEASTRLTKEQRAAVQFIVTNQDRVFAVEGGAGTGKTTLLQEAGRAIESSGRRLRAFAPTASAVDTLRASGFDDAHTVARLLVDERMQQELRAEVLLVDEAGLLGSKTMRQIFDIAEQQRCRVLLVGDTKQHKSVERGDALRVLLERAAIQPVAVTQVQRQQFASFREIVKDISEQKLDLAFDKLARARLLLEISDEARRHQLLSRDYLQTLAEGKTALVISPTHAEGRALTEVIRAEMHERGWLSSQAQRLTRLERLNLTAAERGVSHHYQAGLIVQFHRQAGDFRRGESVVVQGEDEYGRILVERDFGSLEVHDPLPLEHAARFTVYRREHLEVAAGDLIRITKNGKTAEGARINNGDVFRVKEISARGDLLLENGRTLPREYGHLDYGYCLTSHAAQGKTVDRTFNAVGEISLPAATRESFYVTNSRSRDYTKTYTHNLEDYREAVTGERTRLSALDLMNPEPQQTLNESLGENQDKGSHDEPAWLKQVDQELLRAVRKATRETTPPAVTEHDHSFER